MIGWIIEVAYVHLVRDGYIINVVRLVNFTNASNGIPICLPGIPVGTWSLYICNEDSEILCKRSVVPITYMVINITGSDITPSPTIPLPSLSTVGHGSTMYTASNSSTIQTSSMHHNSTIPTTRMHAAGKL